MNKNYSLILNNHGKKSGQMKWKMKGVLNEEIKFKIILSHCSKAQVVKSL